MYKVIKFLSAGSYASVYEIEDEFNMRFALKRIYRKIPVTTLEMHKFIDSDFIIQPLQLIITKNITLNIIYPLAVCDARTYFKQHFTFQQLAIFVSDALYGLNTIHKIQISHRDIKLDNFLVFETGKKLSFKICDFGISQSYNTVSRNQPQYTPIECIFKMPYTCQSDLYSFGIVLLKLLGVKFQIKSKFDQIDIVKSGQRQLVKTLKCIKNLKHKDLLQKRIQCRNEFFSLSNQCRNDKYDIFREMACLCLQMPCQRPTAADLILMFENQLGSIKEHRTLH
ncbi:Kinase [Spironucleus salmonicida]|uniref:Kinase n=1 Tax=Spironucleus salmonicida TaxID=348837 RepID=V6LVN6_9EUKA|nr:Kinase [Spironucleus salmonicida]|eukprot:EST48682.1 Kinase [Spironucleus salmonicida]